MKKLLLSSVLAGLLATGASAWDFCSNESQIGVAATGMGAGVLIADATFGGVPGLIVGAILNQVLCTPESTVENKDDVKNTVETEIKTFDISGAEKIYFDFDQYTLDEEAKADTFATAEILKKNSAVSVKIEGNADARGSDEYNMALGLKRAEAVKTYLIAAGVSNKLETISYGETKPACTEATEDCFAKNRRVEFKSAE